MVENEGIQNAKFQLLINKYLLQTSNQILLFPLHFFKMP